MRKLYLILIIALLYTLIDGFENLFLPMFIAHTLGYKYIWIYSIRFVIAASFCVFITERIEHMTIKHLINFGLFSVLLAGISFFIGNFYTILATIVFMGLMDPIFWGSFKAYITRVSKNVKNDLSLWGIFAILGYVLAGVWPIAIKHSQRLVFTTILLIAIINFIISLFMERDYPIFNPSKKRFRDTIRLNLDILFGFLMILLPFAIFFTIIPVMFKSLKVPVELISLSFILLNIGQIIGNFLVIEEKYEKLKSDLDKALIIGSISSLLIFIFVELGHVTPVLPLLLIFGTIFAVAINNIFLIEVKYINKLIDPDEVSMLSVLAGELSEVVAPALASFLYVYILVLPIILLVSELVYLRRVIFKL